VPYFWRPRTLAVENNLIFGNIRHGRRKLTDLNCQELSSLFPRFPSPSLLSPDVAPATPGAGSPHRRPCPRLAPPPSTSSWGRLSHHHSRPPLPQRRPTRRRALLRSPTAPSRGFFTYFIPYFWWSLFICCQNYYVFVISMVV
jgi:hypothetical protein